MVKSTKMRNNINLEELEAHKIRTFTTENFTRSEVKEAVKQGYMCILDTRGETLGKWAYLLRDYNSYFDLIIVDDPQIAVFLLGYLWDYKILKVFSRMITKSEHKPFIEKSTSKRD